MNMYLSELFAKAPADIQVTGLALDSRQVKAGDLFLAVAGTQNDGRKHIASAIENGAVAVAYEALGAQVELSTSVPLMAIENLQQQVSGLAAKFFGQPSANLQVLGVTGTNGKSSVSQLLAQALDLLAMPCAIVGTLGNGFYGKLVETGHTTPDPVSLQADLALMQEQGAKAVAMEVSSHALDQGRVAGVQFDVALFTNLSRDHLDYHHTMQAYGAAKAKLFAWQHLGARVINLDDTFGAQLAQLEGAGQLISYSEKNPQASIYCTSVHFADQGISAQVVTQTGEQGQLDSPLLGRFNLSNLLAVVGGLLALGFSLSQALSVMPKLQAPAGRMQCLGGQEKPLVVVDYAHTPDALEQVLKALRAHVTAQGRLVAVFGCGGDRDPGKRPLMAQAVERYADFAIVTDDNPRTENPEAIRQQVIQGFEGTQYQVVDGRAQAIATAIASAKAQDVIVLAGKGHEDYQDIQGVKHHFSDLEQAQSALAQWEVAHV
ncbi:UDP-N-acetylmuramoyl-L-alanyl-D-glutamate--2,6-diaminopimelate ligase [Pseudomonas sp. F1_0610]|uniref:UDP-N-acetylmuramoyl-L-alanyl-D-glutamate--2, 6-diaminopimelate ligase n=1 Tax=Pseudomonas sp. F1_0610 TaxID=3114284 RepID=UPI0039C1AA3B